MKLKYFDVLDLILPTDLVTYRLFLCVLSKCGCKAVAAVCFGRGRMCLSSRWQERVCFSFALCFLSKKIRILGDFFLAE